ncbi:MAG: NAD(P)-binding protein, partial [Eggerthellaceae bacterium]|nr:NAD(P)-binding protein [Eggerthellaceae bacterium]
MTISYKRKSEIDFSDYDALVVGCGFAGGVVARQLAEVGKKRVCIIEKRNHIGGNMYDYYDKAGILVHKYGPHIFHTNNKEVFEYLSRFTTFTDYQHCVLADWYDTYIPVPFNKNSMETVFGKEKAAVLIDKLIAAFGDETKVTINQLRSCKDKDLKEIADFVYENVFLHYTMKQWGLTPDEVDPSVTARVPVFISRDNRYFQDTYQGMPDKGYTALFEQMLDYEGIDICLNTEAENVFELIFDSPSENAPLKELRIDGKPYKKPVVFTGPIDELFLSRFGRLPYR